MIAALVDVLDIHMKACSCETFVFTINKDYSLHKCCIVSMLSGLPQSLSYMNSSLM